MARFKTIRKLLDERGPFEARSVNPDLDVVVQGVVPGGVIAEAEVCGERKRVLFKASGIRCPKLERGGRGPVAKWLLRRLNAPATVLTLENEMTGLQNGTIAPQTPEEEALARFQKMAWWNLLGTLAYMSACGEIRWTGDQKKTSANGRKRTYTVWQRTGVNL